MINLIKSISENGFGITEIKILNIESSLTLNDFLIYIAKNSKVGDYPKYFLEQASYWTLSGVNNDVKEALINEDGMVEVDKGLFSIEPMIKIDDSLFNWSNVKAIQSLSYPVDKSEFNFVPTVTWQCDDLKFITQITSSGEANVNTYKANLVYILINRDKAGIQPGSRSYERSWIRDGALTSSALLKSGIVPEVRDFINWYADHQYENGKVPCVVDSRGPDPVP